MPWQKGDRTRNSKNVGSDSRSPEWIAAARRVDIPHPNSITGWGLANLIYSASAAVQGRRVGPFVKVHTHVRRRSGRPSLIRPELESQIESRTDLRTWLFGNPLTAVADGASLIRSY